MVKSKRRYPPELRAAAENLWRQGKRKAEIVELLGLYPQLVDRWIQRLDPELAKRYTDRDRVRRLERASSCEECSKPTGSPKSKLCVECWRKRGSKSPEKEEQALTLMRQGMTAYQAAEKLGVPRGTVTHWRRKGGLSKKRSTA